MVLLWNLSANTGIMHLMVINPASEYAPVNVKAIGQVFPPQTMGSLSTDILSGDQAIAAADRPSVVLTALVNFP
jgi:hypothetical protein